MKKLDLRQPFDALWRGKDPFAEADALSGEEFRHVKNRRTFRVEAEGKGFFVKLHGHSTWHEIFKNLFQGKLPVLGAGNEYRALLALEKLGVDTMEVAAYGERGFWPTRRSSFLITRELAGCVSLEEFVREKLSPQTRIHLIRGLAASVGLMHRAGINHRDCYICHYLLEKGTETQPEARLHVIDLHRAQMRPEVPYRYRVKDVAGLLFSSMDASPTRREVLRFIRIYTGVPLRTAWRREGSFFRAVERAARKLYRREFGREAPPLAGGEIVR